MPSQGDFIEKRKYPRRPWNQPAEVEFKDHLGDRVRGPVVIRSVSPEGMGLAMDLDVELPAVGKMITLSFRLGQVDLTLPGRVIWKQRGPHHTAVGIRLVLELAKASMRQAYARWIVGQIERGDPAKPRGVAAR